MTQLSAQQLAGIEQIKAWYAEVSDREYDGFDGPVKPFRLFGPAGTGKTTMAKAVPEALGLRNVYYGTFTGKAAHVLRSKGAGPVSTIHSAIYKPTTSREAREALANARDELSELANEARADRHEPHPDPEKLVTRMTELEALIPELEANARRTSWELNPDSPWAMADLIILDEVSMVNEPMARDIEALGVPILVLGDPAQLPPVEGGGYYTSARPDFLLTEIHRSALDNPITALATRVRMSTGADLGITRDEMTPASVRHAMEHDQVLCWSNKRRWALTDAMRRLKGFPAGEVVPGDRIMCLTNNRDLAVFNGQQFDVLAVQPGTLGPTLTLRAEDGQEVVHPVYADGFLGREMQDQAKRSGAGRDGRMLATFAWAITVHKAQGSEWPRVYVVNETRPMMSSTRRKEGPAAAIAQGRQWLYTAISRAQETVTITAPRGRDDHGAALGAT
jgi:exodeoxyribonuclease-5